MAIFTFSTQGQKRSEESGILYEEGWYPVIISETSFGPNSQNTGNILKVKFNFAEGVYKGKAYSNGYNVQHQNQEAVRIAYEQLTDLLLASGVPEMQDTQQLHGKCLWIKIVQRADKQGRVRNSLDKCLSIQEYQMREGGQAQTRPAAPIVPPAPAYAPPAAPTQAPVSPENNTAVFAPAPSPAAGFEPVPAPAAGFTPPANPGTGGAPWGNAPQPWGDQ